MLRPEIRCDDVLQVRKLTGHQYRCKGKKTLFQLFLEADELFKKYNYPCTLVILSEGIDVCPEWVEYIKKNQHRYKIELHGKLHRRCNATRVTKELLYDELKEAKDKIEKTFGVKVTTWYQPFGKKGAPIYQDEVCNKLGIRANKEYGHLDVKVWLKGFHKIKKSPFPQVSFHYWSKTQVRYLEYILKVLNEET